MSGMTMTIYFSGTKVIVEGPTNSPDLEIQGGGIVREGNVPDIPSVFGSPVIPEWSVSQSPCSSIPLS